MDDPTKTPHLFHPDLRGKPRSYTYPRMSWLTKWWYPTSEQIGWFGNVRREDGQGMYCTLAQYEALPREMIVHQGDIKIGPG